MRSMRVSSLRKRSKILKWMSLDGLLLEDLGLGLFPAFFDCFIEVGSSILYLLEEVLNYLTLKELEPALAGFPVLVIGISLLCEIVGIDKGHKETAAHLIKLY